MTHKTQAYDLKLNQLSPVAAYSFLKKFIGTIGIETIENNLSKKLSIISRISPELQIFAHLNKSAKNIPTFTAIIRNPIDSATLQAKLIELIECLNDSDDLSEEDDVEFIVDLLQQAQNLNYDQNQTIDLISTKVNESIIDDAKDQSNYDRIADYCEFECVTFKTNGDFYVGSTGKHFQVDEISIIGPEINLNIHCLELAIAIHKSIEIHQLKELIFASETCHLAVEHSKFCTNHLHQTREILDEIFATESSKLLLDVSPVLLLLTLSETSSSASVVNDMIKKKSSISKLSSWDTLYSKINQLNKQVQLVHNFNLHNVRDFNFVEIVNALTS